MTTAKRLLKCLQEKPVETEGICNMLHHNQQPYDWKEKDEESLLLKKLFKQWPLFSGDELYPVPHPNCVGRVNHSRAEGAFHSATNLWDDSPYGNLRKQLHAFCVEQLQKMIEEESKWYLYSAAIL